MQPGWAAPAYIFARSVFTAERTSLRNHNLSLSLFSMTLLASLLNFAGPQLVVILLIILVLFGAKKLPGLARGMGQAIKEFKKAKDEFGQELPPSERAVRSNEPKDTVAEIAEAAYRRQKSIK